MTTGAREMFSDELVDAMENLHLYPRLIAQRAAKEAIAADRERIAAAVGVLRQRHFDHVGGPEVQLAAVLAIVEKP